jgi:hypothetical protein
MDVVRLDFAAFSLAVLIVLALLAFLGLGLVRRARKKPVATPVAARARPEESSFEVSYVPPQFQWSGHSTGALPVKMLTYKQYECLEDGRYGFRIVGLPPTERGKPLPHKTRAHGLKTVASLVKHGFLEGNAEDGYVITDHGLNALEVCSVRY